MRRRLCSVRTQCAVPERQLLQWVDRVCGVRRESLQFWGQGTDLEQIDRVFNLRRECAVSKGLHLGWVHRVCGMVRKCAVSGGSYLYYEERMCSTRREGV